MAKKLMSDIQRFWTHVEHQENGCWLWTGTVNAKYGAFKIGSRTYKTRRMLYAHRFIWEYLNGPIPDGLQLHHVCENKLCVNPEHLELLTVHDHVHKSPNNITYINLHQTHCHRGHEYTPENTYTFRGKRHCRECQRINWRKYDTKNKGVAGAS